MKGSKEKRKIKKRNYIFFIFFFFFMTNITHTITNPSRHCSILQNTPKQDSFPDNCLFCFCEKTQTNNNKNFPYSQKGKRDSLNNTDSLLTVTAFLSLHLSIFPFPTHSFSLFSVSFPLFPIYS